MMRFSSFIALLLDPSIVDHDEGESLLQACLDGGEVKRRNSRSGGFSLRPHMEAPNARTQPSPHNAFNDTSDKFWA